LAVSVVVDVECGNREAISKDGRKERKTCVWFSRLSTDCHFHRILRGIGIQGKLLATEQGVLSVLRTLASSNILDRNDAINLSGQLAAEQIAQFQKLRELQLEDMTSRAAYQGYIIQRQAASEGATQQFFTTAAVTGDGTTFRPGLH
jgi:P-type conjugative transfer protein TrbJ